MGNWGWRAHTAKEPLEYFAATSIEVAKEIRFGLVSSPMGFFFFLKGGRGERREEGRRER